MKATTIKRCCADKITLSFIYVFLYFLFFTTGSGSRPVSTLVDDRSSFSVVACFSLLSTIVGLPLGKCFLPGDEGGLSMESTWRGKHFVRPEMRGLRMEGS